MSKVGYIAAAVISALIGASIGAKIQESYFCKPTSAYVTKLEDQNRKALIVRDRFGHNHALLEDTVSDSLNQSFTDLDEIQRDMRSSIQRSAGKVLY